MSRNQTTEGGDYEVGQGKPPKEHRWQKGQSGNPRGRPKARKTDLVDVSAILDSSVKARIGGKETTVSGFEATFRQVSKKAIGGDLRAIKQFLKICEDYGEIAPPKPKKGGGVVHAPPGVDLHDWLDEVTEWVPVDE